MIATIKSEFRKLLSVRSTYFMLLVPLIIITIMAFWVNGYKGGGQSPAEIMSNGSYVDIFTNAAMIAGIFGSIVAILLVTHEYRYNTIMYTLTNSNSRTKVLLAKVIVVMTFGAAITLICGFAGLALYHLGIAFRPGAGALQPQVINWVETISKLLFYNIGQILLAFMFAVVTRSIPAAIAIIFLVPSTVEPLLALILKEKAAYLPFAAYERVVSGFGGEAAQMVPGTMSVSRAVMVSLAYLVVGGLITWALFVRRDAN